MKVPFFAKYLEEQATEKPEEKTARDRLKTGVRSGVVRPPPQTLKYPSDGDEDPGIIR